MANTYIAKTNFTAGELSPRLYGRQDLDRYANGAKEITNFIVTKQGGLKKRPGTRYVAAVKSQSYANLIIADEPECYFRLGESSGTDMINELGPNGTYTTAPTLGVTGAIDGDANTAVTFDSGSSEFATVPNTALATCEADGLTTGITYEFWMNTTSTDDNMCIFSPYEGNLTAGEGILINRTSIGDDSVSFYSRSVWNTLDLNADCGTGIGILDGAWHHIVIVVDYAAKTVVFYIDGSAVATNYTSQNGTATGPTSAWGGEARVGAMDDTGAGAETKFYNGSLDELAIYPKKLTAAQVAAHYALGATEMPESGQRLIPFQFNNEQGYVIEAGDMYFRFYRDGGALSSQDVSTTITNGDFTADLSGWTTSTVAHDSTNGRAYFDTTNDTMSQAISISSADKDTAHTIKFKVETGNQVGRTLGDTITVNLGTASAGDGGIMGDTDYGAGWHVVTFDPAGNTTVYLEFTRKGSRDMYIDDVAVVDNAQIEIETPYTASRLQSLKHVQTADIIYMAHPAHQPMELRRYGDTSWSLVYHQFSDGPYLDENDEPTDIVGNSFGASLTTYNAYVDGTTTDTTVGINGGEGFRASDVGRLIRHSDTAGEITVAIITAITDSNTVSVTPVDYHPTANANQASTNWRLGAWYDAGDGETEAWPGAVGMHASRLWWGGSDDQKQTAWSSVVNDLNNYQPSDYDGTVLDDQGIVRTIADDQVERVNHIFSTSRGLIMLTAGSEVLARASQVFTPITPTDFTAIPQSYFGSKSSVRPILAQSGLVIYVQAAGTDLMESQYQFDRDIMVGTDLTILSDHITETGINDIAYTQQPDNVFYAILGTGRIAAMTYEREQRVIAWSHIEIGGTSALAEAVCSIRNNTEDQVWVVVSRTINGSTKRYIEYFASDFDGTLDDKEDAFYVDSGLTYDSTSTSTITGLDHLEGESVSVWGDGSFHGSFTVSSGSVTLDVAVEVAQIGLPYTSTIETLELTPESTRGADRSIICQTSIKSVWLRLVDSLGGSIVGGDGTSDELIFRRMNDPMDSSPPLYSGMKQVDYPYGSMSLGSKVKLVHSNPCPFNINQMVVKLDAGNEIND